MALRGRFGPLLTVLLLAVSGWLQGCGDDDEVTTPTCSEYSQNGVGPITDSASCRDACETGEGLSETSCGLEYWSGSSCTCLISCTLSDTNAVLSEEEDTICVNSEGTPITGIDDNDTHDHGH